MLEYFGIIRSITEEKKKRRAATALVHLSFDFTHKLSVDFLHTVSRLVQNLHFRPFSVSFTLSITQMKPWSS